MTKGIIFKIKKYALHDGPGIRTTVFFKGCPLSCRWCHNPEGIDPRPQTMSRRTLSGKINETVGTVIGVDELVKEIEKDLLFYDESGGALDTSGFAPPAVVDLILPRLQLVLFDLKIMDAKQHHRYTGVSNRIILENLKRIAGSETPVRIRVPLIPGITDGDDNIAEIVRFAGALKTIQGVDLLPFHRIGGEKYRRLGLTDNMAGTVPPVPERVEEIKNRFESARFDVSIGG
ncbi:MAG: 4Fe-4S cluster-binding domain-containing protein [Desulfosarcina sp.]|nr:4Fe-4S cluster-binding domain-containing protein [Desulfosarcina sp.]